MAAKDLTSHEKKQQKKQQRETEKKQQSQQALAINRKKSITKYSIIAVIAVLGVVGLIALSSFTPETPNSTYDNEILNINLAEHKNLALHIHPILEIEILGEKQTIPANIGISSAGMKVVHTHDTTGTIHVETPYPTQLHLRDFFTIWNKMFNSTCIFENCKDESHELLMFVDGEENTEFENLPLQDKQQIKIGYIEKE